MTTLMQLDEMRKRIDESQQNTTKLEADFREECGWVLFGHSRSMGLVVEPLVCNDNIQMVRLTLNAVETYDIDVEETRALVDYLATLLGVEVVGQSSPETQDPKPQIPKPQIPTEEN